MNRVGEVCAGGGGLLGMFTIDDIVKNKQMTCVCKKIHSEMHSWNALGKHWLEKYDNKFGVDLFSL
jgi:hypothetical protein